MRANMCTSLMGLHALFVLLINVAHLVMEIRPAGVGFDMSMGRSFIGIAVARVMLDGLQAYGFTALAWRSERLPFSWLLHCIRI